MLRKHPAFAQDLTGFQYLDWLVVLCELPTCLPILAGSVEWKTLLNSLALLMAVRNHFRNPIQSMNNSPD